MAEESLNSEPIEPNTPGRGLFRIAGALPKFSMPHHRSSQRLADTIVRRGSAFCRTRKIQRHDSCGFEIRDTSHGYVTQRKESFIEDWRLNDDKEVEHKNQLCHEKDLKFLLAGRIIFTIGNVYEYDSLQLYHSLPS